MTNEEYILQRLLNLEKENAELKEEIEQIKKDRTLMFMFEDRHMADGKYNIEFNNKEQKIIISKRIPSDEERENSDYERNY